MLPEATRDGGSLSEHLKAWIYKSTSAWSQHFLEPTEHDSSAREVDSLISPLNPYWFEPTNKDARFGAGVTSTSFSFVVVETGLSACFPSSRHRSNLCRRCLSCDLSINTAPSRQKGG